ncbi:MAG: hypothetical protein CMA54_01780 [Euryarchaeota archaeon]|nr:hypothetical protein [Euryarchaeota archaeon]
MSVMQSGAVPLESYKDMIDGEIERLVLERLSSPRDQPAMGLAREVLLAGGKRYRPMLGLIAYEAAGGEDVGNVMDFALSAELIHTATLVHDDVYDRSKMRRGKPTIHASHGIPHAIIAGDYLFALGFELGARHESRIIDLVSASCARVASGEILQLEHIRDLSTQPENYYEIIDGKTAGPFATACSCAAIVADHEEFVEPMWNYGMEMGRAFQLVDDLLDLIGDESTGKPRGTDVLEGKMTLPIIHALTVTHGADRDQLADVLTNYNDSRLRELTDLLERAGSFDYSQLLISNHIERALESLSSLPDSGAKGLLIDFAEMSRSRTN